MPELNEAKLNAFLGRAVNDLGAAMSNAMVVIGDKLGLYKAMASGEPVTPGELAHRTRLHERYVREWLDNQAAGGYVTYDPVAGTYELPPEHAFCLADESSPAFLCGGFELVAAAQEDANRAMNDFRTGGGMAWGEHDPRLFPATERFFRPNYNAHLVDEWLPALEGVREKLSKGARVADVGCGLGASTVLMAEAFPRSTFVGFDDHTESIDLARERAERADVAKRVRFEVASASDFAGPAYDLVAFFDCLHDMADPAGAARHTREMLKPDGTWMVVEPYAGDRPEQNHNPVGRLYYGASALLCVPCSLAGDGPALGAQAGEARIRNVIVEEGGFRRFRRAAETPFNLVFEARP